MKKIKFWHWLVICFVGMLIVGLGIGYTMDRSKNKNVKNTQTQIITPKTESPIVDEKKEEVQVEESPKSTTKKDVSSEPAPESTEQPQPTEQSQPPEQSSYIEPCNDTKKQADIYFENSYYQDLVNIENQRHNNVTDQAQKTLNDCLATNPEPQVWCVQYENLNEENNYHESQLASLESTHQVRISIIDRTCY